jgi:hypothetical protein
MKKYLLPGNHQYPHSPPVPAAALHFQADWLFLTQQTGESLMPVADNPFE